MGSEKLKYTTREYTEGGKWLVHGPTLPELGIMVANEDRAAEMSVLLQEAFDAKNADLADAVRERDQWKRLYNADIKSATEVQSKALIERDAALTKLTTSEARCKRLEEIATTTAPPWVNLAVQAANLLKLMDDVGDPEKIGDEADRVFARYEFEGLRKALASLAPTQEPTNG